MVEIKSFFGRSRIHDLEVALGQHTLYLGLLEVVDPERRWYLAVSEDVYAEFFEQPAVQLILRRFEFSVFTVDLDTEEIVRWIR